MKWIGLTGGIATGKSTAARALRGLGVDVIDADQLAREAVAPGSPGLADVAKEFGTKVLAADGSLDRKALGALAFADAGRRARLEEIVHPRVRARCLDLRRALERAGKRFAFYDVPLLFEKRMDRDFDLVVAVLCSPEEQRRRLIARDGLSPVEAEARISSQLPMAEKERCAGVVIRNDGSVAELEAKIAELVAGL